MITVWRSRFHILGFDAKQLNQEITYMRKIKNLQLVMSNNGNPSTPLLLLLRYSLYNLLNQGKAIKMLC